MDDPSDDPRPRAFDLSISDDSLNSRQDEDEDGRPVGGMANVLELLSTVFGSSSDQPRNTGDSGGGRGMRIMINDHRGVRTVQLGGSNTLGQGGSRPREGNIPRLSEYALPHGCLVSII